MDAIVPISFVLALVAVIFRIMFRSRSRIIKNPVLGLLNIGGAAFTKFVEQDRAALAPLFATIKESKRNARKAKSRTRQRAVWGESFS